MSKKIAIKFKLKGKIDSQTFSNTTKVKDALIQYLNSKGLIADPSEEKYTFMYGAHNHINSNHAINLTIEDAKIRNNGIVSVETKDDILLG